MSSNDDSECVESDKKTRKRKVHGRMRDVAKKMRVQSHEAGASCNCRYKCFDKVGLTQEVRDKILQQFNLLETTNEQNSYLCGLMSIVPVQKRRPKIPSDSSKSRDVSCKYKVRSSNNGVVFEWEVCRKAFKSIHGITEKKIEGLINGLKDTGCSPKDKRGKHSNRPHKISDEAKDLIKTHINSFNGRGAHYSLRDTSKKYLPDDLNISVMHKMFEAKFPEIKCSYESYRAIMQSNFNISFGYPRTDTCSFCDETNVKLGGLRVKLKETKDEETRIKVNSEIKTLETELKLHKLKANKFYEQKRKARLTSQKIPSFEGICIDYGRNLSVPNVTTNDAYYKRQLSIYSFNVHILGSGKSVFYTYPECKGKKGSDNICQMLFHFVDNHLPENVENLHIFGDSCGGQNKNLTVYRFLHYLVHVKKRFKNVQFTYPIRGHSYTECDRNMGRIKSNFWADIPSEWAKHFREARQNPSPFVVEEVDYNFWREWKNFLELTYAKKIPVMIRAMKEIKVAQSAERLLYFRNNYSGHWDSVVITLPKRKRFIVDPTTLPEVSLKEILLTAMLMAHCTHSEVNDKDGTPLAAAFANSFVPKLFQVLYTGRDNTAFAPLGLAVSVAMVIEAEPGELSRRQLNLTVDLDLLRSGFRNILLESENALQEEEAAGIYNKIIMLTAHNLSQQNFFTFTDFYRANVSVSTSLINASEQVVSLQSDSGVMSHWKDFQKLAVYTYLSHEAAAPFTTATGAITHVPFIPQVGVFRAAYLPKLFSQAVQLPLQSQRVHLILLLPDSVDKIQEILTSFAKENLLLSVKSLPLRETEVSLPQLAILSKNIDLAPVLHQIGLAQLFTNSYSQIRSIKQDVYFSTSFVAINSVGSLTTLLGVKSARKSKREINKVIFDRPFLFFLVHSSSDAILLAGVVQNPTQVPFTAEHSTQ